MARSHWKSIRRSSRPARMASNEYVRLRALGYVVPFGMSSMYNGAWNQYVYQKTYGRKAKYVTPWGAYSRARRGMSSMAPHDITRYYK